MDLLAVVGGGGPGAVGPARRASARAPASRSTSSGSSSRALNFVVFLALALTCSR